MQRDSIAILASVCGPPHWSDGTPGPQTVTPHTHA